MSKKRAVRGTTSIVKHLHNIDQEVAKHGISIVQSLAVDAAEEAQNHIMKVGYDQNFTQKYGPEAIAREVGATKISEKSWGVVAPAYTKTLQMSENMYYAEYGAGILRDSNVPAPVAKTDKITITTRGGKRGTIKRTFKVTGSGRGILWRYNTTANDMAKDATGMRVSNKDFPVKFLTTRGWQGVTDRSKPLHYMTHARAWLRDNGAKNARKTLQTIIYRRKDRGPYGGSSGEDEE